MSHAIAAGLLFTIGSVLFLIGAGFLSSSRRALTAPLPESVSMLRSNPERWRLKTWTMTAAVVSTTAGFFVFASIPPMAGSVRALSGSVGYLIGAVLWILALTFRETATLSAADETERTGTVPGWLEAIHAWTGRVLAIHTMLAYLTIAVFGWTIVSTHALAAWTGWFAIVYGSLLGLSTITRMPTAFLGPANQPPVLIYIPTLVFGIALLFR